MSSKRGDVGRTRAQRHQNRTVFKNDLHDNSDKIKKLNAMSITEVCLKCKEVIEWKIRYRKYKPLTQPKVCNGCNQKTVRKAYHVLCHDCAIAAKKCAKCLRSASESVEIIPPEPDHTKLDIEMKQMLKTLPERKRRTFLRFLNGKKKSKKNTGDDEDEDSNSEKPRVQHTKDELLLKLQQLNVAKDDDDLFNDEDFSSDEEGWASDLSN